jgi:hypothetical protein
MIVTQSRFRNRRFQTCFPGNLAKEMSTARFRNQHGMEGVEIFKDLILLFVVVTLLGRRYLC